jgi:hypothetical protein
MARLNPNPNPDPNPDPDPDPDPNLLVEHCGGATQQRQRLFSVRVRVRVRLGFFGRSTMREADLRGPAPVRIYPRFEWASVRVRVRVKA